MPLDASLHEKTCMRLKVHVGFNSTDLLIWTALFLWKNACDVNASYSISTVDYYCGCRCRMICMQSEEISLLLSLMGKPHVYH